MPGNNVQTLTAAHLEKIPPEAISLAATDTVSRTETRTSEIDSCWRWEMLQEEKAERERLRAMRDAGQDDHKPTPAGEVKAHQCDPTSAPTVGFQVRPSKRSR